jgi:hypothetical protein
MRKDVREFIRRLEAVGLTVESTPGHYRVLRDGEPLRKANGMPFMLPFSPDTIRSAQSRGGRTPEARHRPVRAASKRRSPPTFRSPGFDSETFSPAAAPVKLELLVTTGGTCRRSHQGRTAVKNATTRGDRRRTKLRAATRKPA